MAHEIPPMVRGEKWHGLVTGDQIDPPNECAICGDWHMTEADHVAARDTIKQAFCICDGRELNPICKPHREWMNGRITCPFHGD